MARLSRFSPNLKVFINGQENKFLRVMTIQRSTNGHRLDHAVLRYDFGLGGDSGQYLRQSNLNAGTSGEVEIVRASDGYVYHWGKLAIDRIAISDRGGEVLELVSRIEPFHFGEPLIGQQVWDAKRKKPINVLSDTIFNPESHGICQGNKHPKHDNTFLDPDSCRTKTSQQLQGGEPDFWKLSEVINYLCFTCNFDQKYVNNPKLSDLKKVFDDEKDLIRHLHLPYGRYLPHYLDEVLRPIGYSWFVRLDGRGKRSLQFYARGVGTDNTVVTLQDVGSTLDPNVTNLADMHVEYNIAAIANDVTGLGSHEEYEAVFELYRGWSKGDDDLRNQPEKLREGSKDFDKHRDTWRKWVLNEAGDYTGTRPEIRDPYDLSKLTGNAYQVKRRRFLPMLTLADHGDGDYHPAGTIRGCKVEYYDKNISSGATGQSNWRDVTHECHILHDECGIYFGGALPPEDIMRQGDAAKVRITATVQLDYRIVGRAGRLRDSVNADTVAVVLDLHDRFHYKKSTLAQTTPKAKTLEADDRDDLRKYCEQIRGSFDVAEVNGSLVLEGIDRTNYELGQSVTKVAGREIDFNGKSAQSSLKLYPQIVGITYDVQGQKTSLTLEQFKAHNLAAFSGAFHGQ